MDPNFFDDLARLFASNVSRRQMLRYLLGGAGMFLLGLIGLDLREHSADAGPAAQSGAFKLFLPVIMNACMVASTCADKVYCSADQQCRCIASAEGPIRCGRIPDCSIQHCKTSADCASLGPDHFCDTPYSGCCTDAEQQRCIAPCIPTGCPSERICGANCCPEGQVCTGGKLCCPAAQACGATCCPTGYECLNGKCTVTCAGDPVTADSLAAAQAAFANGATTINLSPKGCLVYSRTFSGTTVTSETIHINHGYRTVQWNHSGNTSTGHYDLDLDGYMERAITVTRGATASTEVITEYDPTTHAATYRKTITRDTLFHVLLEKADSSGVFQQMGKWDQDLTVEALAPTPDDVSQANTPTGQSGACTALQCSTMKQKLTTAFLMGQQCMADHQAYGLQHALMDAFFRTPIEVQCKSIPPKNGFTVLAHTEQSFPWPLDLNPHAWIAVNSDNFCGMSETDQLMTLFHESMHLLYPDHEPNQEHDSRRTKVVPFYACAQMCFHPEASSQCECATCLATTKCDERCGIDRGFTMCADDFGAWCPCPTNSRWYSSCLECLVDCPSGLACFGYSHCTPQPGDCNTGKKCPP